MWFSLAPNKTAINSTPFATVAFAGHSTVTGAWCQCGSSEYCICDPGETNIHSQTSKKPSANGKALSGAATEFDAGASALLVTLALLLGLRVRF